jgi:hypothetical protein
MPSWISWHWNFKRKEDNFFYFILLPKFTNVSNVNKKNIPVKIYNNISCVAGVSLPNLFSSKNLIILFNFNSCASS